MLKRGDTGEDERWAVSVLACRGDSQKGPGLGSD